MTTRPSETIAGAVGAVLGAVQIIVGALDDGFSFSDLSDPEVTGAITVIVGLVASVVTYFVAKRQRAGTLQSAPDGTVQT